MIASLQCTNRVDRSVKRPSIGLERIDPVRGIIFEVAGPHGPEKVFDACWRHRPNPVLQETLTELMVPDPVVFTHTIHTLPLAGACVAVARFAVEL